MEYLSSLVGSLALGIMYDIVVAPSCQDASVCLIAEETPGDCTQCSIFVVLQYDLLLTGDKSAELKCRAAIVEYHRGSLWENSNLVMLPLGKS